MNTGEVKSYKDINGLKFAEKNNSNFNKLCEKYNLIENRKPRWVKATENNYKLIGSIRSNYHYKFIYDFIINLEKNSKHLQINEKKILYKNILTKIQTLTPEQFRISIKHEEKHGLF